MDTVGLKMLKESLGTYVARASEGERFIITDRGEEVAELVPISPSRRVLLRLVAEGKVKWNGERPKFWGRRDLVRNTGPLLSDAVIEDRR